MQYLIFLLVLVSVVAADGTLQKPETTSAPAVDPGDLASEIDFFTSFFGAMQSGESYAMSNYSSQFATLTASAASASSSLSLQLSTADAAASTSIQSQLSQVAANVSRAASAMQAAQSFLSSTSTSSSSTSSSSSSSSSTGGVGCAQTAAVGMGALVGGMAVLAQL